MKSKGGGRPAKISSRNPGIQDSRCGICGQVCDEPNPVDFYVPGTFKLVCSSCMPYKDDMAMLFLLMNPNVTDAEAKRLFPTLERTPEFEAALAQARAEQAKR